MRNLRLYMILFCVLVSLPMAFVAWRTYGALDREARAQVRFFAEKLLDGIEAELEELVRREERRAVDEYSYTRVAAGGKTPSPLASLPGESYILGYFQNNPDGTFQTPLIDDSGQIPKAHVQRVRQLESINVIFNQRKLVARIQEPQAEPAKTRKKAKIAKKETASFADRFLKPTERKQSKSVLGQQTARVEEITAGQALNLAQKEPPAHRQSSAYESEADVSLDATTESAYIRSAPPAAAPLALEEQRQTAAGIAQQPDQSRFQVEVAPLQAVAIDAEQIFIFRRVGINGEIYRQGFVVQLQPFLAHLIDTYYTPQPIAGYTRLVLNAAGRSVTGAPGIAPEGHQQNDGIAARTFPAPFGFLVAEMKMVALPPSPARQTFTLALGILAIVMAAGLVAIYHSARTVLDLSERRSQFVSTVTHELKTPLTNIRMYIEMLDQGIAATPEREQEYLGILASESARLSGLINNVLELSRLEKQTRRFDIREGDVSDVLDDVRSIMAATLDREGFELEIRTGDLSGSTYDREVLVQMLMNLMENSIKFGRHLPEKRITIAVGKDQDTLTLRVSDTGPGIPRRALKHVFDDFYRVDNDLNRTTGGTGIGLALVKKFVLAMDGRVKAENNEGAGCTIRITLPQPAQV